MSIDEHDLARQVRNISDELSEADESGGEDSEINEILHHLNEAANKLETRGSALFP